MSSVEDQRLGVEAVLVAGDLADPLGDLDLALGRLRHPDLVDRQRDQRRAVRLGQRHDDVGLVAARLEVDRVDDRPAGDLLQRRLDHLGLGRVDLDRRRLGQRDPLDHGAHLLVLVLALGQRDADVEHVGAAFDLVFGDLDEAVVVVGEQQFLGLFRALRVDPLADQGRARLLHQRGRGHHRGDLDRARRRARARRRGRRPARGSRRCARGSCRSSRRRCRRRSARRTRPGVAASGSGSSGKIVSPSGPCRGRPALGMQWTGSGLVSPRKRIASRMSSGPVEQLRPTTSTSSAVSVVSTDRMSVPSSILPPLGSSETLICSGSRAAGLLERLAGAEDRRLDLEDVLRGLDDDQVGAALDQARAPARRRPRPGGRRRCRRGSGRSRRGGSRSGRSSRRRSGRGPPPCGRFRPPWC